jgi:hypothetical protein
MLYIQRSPNREWLKHPRNQYVKSRDGFFDRLIANRQYKINRATTVAASVVVICVPPQSNMSYSKAHVAMRQPPLPAALFSHPHLLIPGPEVAALYRTLAQLRRFEYEDRRLNNRKPLCSSEPPNHTPRSVRR